MSVPPTAVPPTAVPPTTVPVTTVPSDASAKVVDEKANQTTVRFRVGTRVELLLHSDYWTVVGSSRPDVLAQDGPTRQLPRTPSTCPPGVGCQPLQTFFTARTPGSAVVSATRTTCGEALRCLPGQGSLRITVVVTP